MERIHSGRRMNNEKIWEIKIVKRSPSQVNEMSEMRNSECLILWSYQDRHLIRTSIHSMKAIVGLMVANSEREVFAVRRNDTKICTVGSSWYLQYLFIKSRQRRRCCFQCFRCFSSFHFDVLLRSLPHNYTLLHAYISVIPLPKLMPWLTQYLFRVPE